MPWGNGEIIEEATAVGKWGEPAIQLLRYDDGSESIRFCQYDHRGRFRRSPLMVDAKLLGVLGGSLARTPRLRSILRAAVAASAPRARPRVRGAAGSRGR